ncbi:MAG: DUF4417 domain-containing protein [Acutalibacteraceae bacterium]|jgi:hypothetical protein
MSKLNNSRSGCKDVFRSFLVKNATYDGHLEMPCIKLENAVPQKLIVFSKAVCAKDFHGFVHFFEDDVNFERIWNTPNRYLPILKKFDGVITPDFSLYRDMPLVMQEWNTYRSRAIGHWLQENGITVIPNIRFADERSYTFCCDGVSKGGTIAVGSHGCIKVKVERVYFEKGLGEVIRKLEPKRVIVYGKAPDDIFSDYIKSGIEICQYDSEYSLSRKAVSA